MLARIIRQFAPFSLPLSATAYPILTQIASDLEACREDEAAARVMECWKANLYSHLSWRFPEPIAQALAIKTLNILLARHHLWRRSTALGSRPIGLVVDPSNACQLGCPGCVHSAKSELHQIFDWRSGTLPEDRFSALLRTYGPYAIGVYFCNYGEPLLNLQTPGLIRRAKTYLLQTALSTSLSVRKFDAEAYVDCGLDYMALAIDGATQSVYERFRKNGNLELVLENLRRLVAARRQAGKKTPVLCWNFLAFEHNYHEIPDAARLASRLGVDQFRVVEPFDVSWDDPDIRPAPVDQLIRRFSWTSRLGMAANWNPFPREIRAPEIAESYHRPWTWHASDSGTEDSPTCQWLYKNMAMDANGRVMPCCAPPSPDREIVFGEFNGAGDPYNSARYRQARAYFANGAQAGPDAPYCSRCEWVNQPVNIGEQQIWTYFRSADAAFFDRKSLELLGNW